MRWANGVEQRVLEAIVSATEKLQAVPAFHWACVHWLKESKPT